MILDTIFENRKKQVDALKRGCPYARMEAEAFDFAKRRPTLDFEKALRAPGLSVIAEVKKASPSKGLICPDFDPVRTACAYQRGGAAAISVLTEETYFQGASAYLAAVRGAVSLPLLRKDFIFDEWQICEARLLGADAILLIAAMLHKARLAQLLRYAQSLGLACLVETHTEREVEAAVEAGAAIFGVNNRNLNDFTVDLDCAVRLSKLLPKDAVFVAESGIHTRADAERMLAAGAHAVLVGESLMRAPDIGEKLRTFRVER